MKREQAVATLLAHKGDLHRRGVLHAELFGSVARDEATAESDLDILIDLDPEAPIDMFAYVGIKRYIAGLFSIPVDVVNRKALKQHIRKLAAMDMVHVF